MERAGLKLAEVIPIHTKEANALYLDLLRLAEAARRGEISGIAYTALTPEGGTRQGILGRAKRNAPHALLGAHRLVQTLVDISP